MTPIQQLMLGVGASKKTYMDDVFSTYLYEETGSTVTVNNGVDMSEGGMVWFKNREATDSHVLVDTVRGGTKVIHSNATSAESTQSGAITSFNNNGFAIGNYGNINGGSNKDVASWSFRKAKGFFDVVTYTGNGSSQNISHSLGCVPGCYMIKRTDASADWKVFHRSLNGPKWYLNLNGTQQQYDLYSLNNNTAPTASVFTVGSDSEVNANNGEYVVYLFAGGESTAATARSVDFDGTGDYLSISDHADFHFGNGNFCVELWIKGTANNANRNIIGQWAPGQMGWSVFWAAGNQGHNAWGFKYSTNGSNETQVSDILLDDDQWHHIAVVRDGNDVKLYRDGKYRTKLDVTDVTFNDSSAELRIANDGWNSPLDCHISNVRVVKGSSVYTTTTYRIPTEPLTNITNTKLLCCNGTSTTSSTVTPGTITANGDPTSSTVTPFDDPAAFKFGDSEEGIIKSGSYVGNGSATGPEINLGWEPQFILMKNAEKSENWLMWDSMRGIVTGDNDARLFPNLNTAESSPGDFIDLTSTGFKIKDNGGDLNENDDKIIYLCIRRPDGYVGKPYGAGEGTSVFAMDTGNNSYPSFTSNFPVDFGVLRRPTTSENWWNGARLIGEHALRFNGTEAEADDSNITFDRNDGWYGGGGGNKNSTYQSWMWKRHAGFDCVAYKGNDPNGVRDISHSLNAVPEMIILKKRDATGAWCVGHKGLNGGTNPWTYLIQLESSGAEQQHTTAFASTAPTSTVFTVGPDNAGNGSYDYLALLFASTDVSKVGYYTGTESSNAITTGFQPRFVFVKCTSTAASWVVWDTTRGVGNYLLLNTDQAQGSASVVTFTSTGFTLTGTSDSSNGSGEKYIYYCHA